MKVTLQYFDDCPNWRVAAEHLETLRSEGFEFALEQQEITTPEAAEEHRFHGSPTILVDGADPFADPDAPVGLACRTYRTETGYAGSPSLEQLREAMSGTRVR